MKHKKTILIAAAVVLGVAVAIGGIFLILRLNREPVLVIPASEVSMSGSFYGENSLYGSVMTDQIQAEYLSDTQNVTAIHVAQGDTVKAGEPLFDYDTTLTDLQLQRKELEIKKQERELENAQNEYKALFGQTFSLPEPSMTVKREAGALSASKQNGIWLHLLSEEITTETPAVTTEETTQSDSTETEATEPAEPTEEGTVTTYERVGGKGTEEEPYLFVVADSYAIDTALLDTILGEKENVSVVFAQCEGNRTDGVVLSAWGMTLERAENGSCQLHLTDASAYVGTLLVGGQDEPTDEPDDPNGGGMTYEELQKLRAEKERALIDLDLSLRMARVEYKKMQAELGDGTVYAALDGVVISVGDPETAFLSGEAIVKVSGGGGFLVEGTVSELCLDDIMIGRAVSVTSWSNGATYDGVITAVSDVPTTNGGWADGNNNVSFYPFTVTVDDSAELMDGEYVEMQLGGESESDSFYLEKMYILQENGKNYVYAAGENGRLERREVVVGKDLWGSYFEICSGITAEDQIAFPYGKNVEDGAKTKQGSVSDLYGW